MMPTRKEPELQIKTTLAKFSTFLKALALSGLVAGGGAVGGLAMDKRKDNRDDIQDSLLNVIQTDLAIQKTKISTVEDANLEIKTRLVEVQSDIKQLLFYAGKADK